MLLIELNRWCQKVCRGNNSFGLTKPCWMTGVLSFRTSHQTKLQSCPLIQSLASLRSHIPTATWTAGCSSSCAFLPFDWKPTVNRLVVSSLPPLSSLAPGQRAFYCFLPGCLSFTSITASKNSTNHAVQNSRHVDVSCLYIRIIEPLRFIPALIALSDPRRANSNTGLAEPANTESNLIREWHIPHPSTDASS